MGVESAYHLFEKSLPECDDVSSYEFDFKPVQKSIDTFSKSVVNFPAMPTHLMKHEAEIMKDANAVDGDYEKFGELVGKIFKLVSEEEEAPKPTVAVTEQGENYRLVLAEIA